MDGYAAETAMEARICLTPERRRFHVTTESLSLVLVAPLLIWAGTRKRPLNAVERWGLIGVAASIVLIDGYLLSRFAAGRGD